jgi:anaerobic magnesium-protoporphyrin IX monomethyl ester cyclase
MMLTKSLPKVLIVTTPIRPIPTEYPPLGSLALVKRLRKSGVANPEFFDIDGLRPTIDEAVHKIIQLQPDILGISAVVSTAYGYAKELSLKLKAAMPDLTIVLGGNLGASAEILLRKTGVDFVAVGEGEDTLVQFVGQYQTGKDKNHYSGVKGLMFLDDKNHLVNTGYPLSLPKDEIYDIDWDDLERNSNIEIFFPKVDKSLLAQSTFSDDPRAYSKNRLGKTIGTLVASKGCVARCTFCHRWDKGIRYVPVPLLMERLKEVIDRFNVGFVTFGDENFGTDRRWLSEFCKEIKKFDVLWRVSGMRVNCVSPDNLEMMKDAGCSAVFFGMETGSQKMLQIMEKKVKLEDNYNALSWIREANLKTTIQLVLGMPGETTDTIKETAEFVAFGARLKEDQNPLDVSINYAQALPGTSLYEFARHNNLIGQSLDDEEQYLLAISDRDASDETTTLNLSGHPKLISECWRPNIIARMGHAYIKKFGKDSYRKQIAKSHYFSVVSDQENNTESDITHPDTGYFNYPAEKLDADTSNIKSRPVVDVSGFTETTNRSWNKTIIKNDKLPSLRNLLTTGNLRIILVLYPEYAYRLRFFMPLFVLLFNVRRNGAKYSISLIMELLKFFFTKFTSKGSFSSLDKSLRKYMEKDVVLSENDAAEMIPLRKGR